MTLAPLFEERIRRELASAAASLPADLPCPERPSDRAVWHPERTAAEAIAWIDGQRAALASMLAQDVETFAALLVPPKLREAVLARRVLVDRWPWSTGDATDNGTEPIDAARCLEALGRSVRQRAPEPTPPHSLLQVPPEVALLDAVEWCATALEKAAAYKARDLVRAAREKGYELRARHWDVTDEAGTVRSLWPYQLGLMFLAFREVEADRRRPAIAIDAGKVHHGLLMGWTEATTQRKLDAEIDPATGYVELFLPGQQQIALGLPGEAHEQFITELRNWRSPKALRTYATLLHLLSIRGSRAGFVRWTVEEHLDVQGVPRKERREERVRAEVEEVERLTKIELAVRENAQGKVRERRPVFIVGSRFERLEGSRWELDGMEIQPNPLIYRGVRDPETGSIGSNFGLGTDRLPQLNPQKHSAALALGLLLPIRFRLALNESKDYVLLQGANVLRYAGIKFSKHDSGRAWRQLEEDLEELRRIGGIGGWEWQSPGGPSLSNVLRFMPPDWQRDRMLLGVRPVELPAARPLTGDELRAWRTAQRLSQAQAAQALGVGLRTVKRAEAQAAEALGPALREALQAALGGANSGAKSA